METIGTRILRHPFLLHLLINSYWGLLSTAFPPSL